MKKIATGTTGIYAKVPCVVSGITHPNHPEWQLLKFQDRNGDIGWIPDQEDISWGIENIPGVTYLWLVAGDTAFISDTLGHNCIVCNEYNKWAEPNLIDGRYICYSCKSTYAWKYEGQFLE